MYRIWTKILVNGTEDSVSVSAKEYSSEKKARAAAVTMYPKHPVYDRGTEISFESVVAEENPFLE